MQHEYHYGPGSLSYWDKGAGEITLLFIHGFGEDHLVWKSQIEFLSKFSSSLPASFCEVNGKL